MTDKETFEKWLEHHLDWHGSATLRSAWNHQQKKIAARNARIAELENWHKKRSGAGVPEQSCPYCDNAKKAYFDVKSKLSLAVEGLRSGVDHMRSKQSYDCVLLNKLNKTLKQIGETE